MNRVLCLIAIMLISAVSSISPLAGCPPLPPHTAQTIQDLRPNDVKVVMTLGGSMAAGYGINGSSIECRGESFCGGGDVNVTTLPNLLSSFSQSLLLGASLSSHDAVVCNTGTCTFQYVTTDQLNAAHSGAGLFDIAGQELSYLTRQLNVRQDINVATDWKVLNFVMDADDLCNACTYDTDFMDAGTYMNNLMALMERIRLTLPRTFVNIIPPFTTNQIYELSLQDFACETVTRSVYVGCDCIFSADATATRALIDGYLAEYTAAAQQVASYYNHRAYTNFAVVVQPFTSNTFLSNLGTQILSPVDCFHFSRIMHSAMAVALWNNMINPMATKSYQMSLSDLPLCPINTTLIYTY